MANPSDDLLAAELRELAGWLAVPDPPDLRAAVRTRLAAPSNAPSTAPSTAPSAASAAWVRRPIRRWLAAAAAVVVATVAVVPPARQAVANAVGGVLRFAGIEIRTESRDPGSLPSQPSPLPSIRSAALDEARRLARFAVRVPTQLGVPEEVTVADPAPDGSPNVVSMSYRGGTVRFDQFDGELDRSFIKQARDYSEVRIGNRAGYWFPTRHALTYVDRLGVTREATARLAGPTLVWTDGRVTYRLEGLPLAEATEVAASVR